jgi:myosin heavy subunit
MAMYTSYIMRRTQIYLTEEQGRLLESRSKATGTTVSQLIRTAVDSVYSRRRAMSKAQRVRLARSAAGSWKTFAETGEEYVERIRGSRRLARLHGVE